jgi:mono/diheme cytochrome c family protein
MANGKGHMPKFGDKLTPDEIASLADQIKALK